MTVCFGLTSFPPTHVPTTKELKVCVPTQQQVYAMCHPSARGRFDLYLLRLLKRRIATIRVFPFSFSRCDHILILISAAPSKMGRFSSPSVLQTFAAIASGEITTTVWLQNHVQYIR